MVMVLGVLVVLFLAVLLIGAVTGRVKVSSCCVVADPQCDARMRDAFARDDARRYQPGSAGDRLASPR